MITDLFADQVRARPEAVAVTCDGVSLTYWELDARADALARLLRERYAVGSDRLVALVLDRGERVLIGMLAVAKAGGAYVPIAPDTPDSRIKLILRETATPLVLTDDAHRDRLADIVRDAHLETGVRTVTDATAAGETIEPSEDVAAGQPGSLAYVIYTSGTTGRPKGVMVEHRSLVHYVRNVRERLGLSPDDTCDYSTNVAFDLTVTTTLACLALGGRVSVYTGPRRDVDAYRRHLAREGVTFLKLTPSYFGLIADSLGETVVRTVVLGGEKLGTAVLQRIRTRTDQPLTVHDEYGPTEATVGTCSAIVHPLPPGRTPSIGTLYDGYRSHVLDADLRPVPAGEIGELHIGGAGLARGYLGQPELTAARFRDIPELASADGDGRYYATGDLVRWRTDGELEYVGRNDDQVKIRGFRVELGEVEHALEGHGDVVRAVVLSRAVGGEHEVRRLVAYVVAGEFGCDEEALSEYLREILPEYLVPSVYVFLDKLPLTTNGKADRAALPKPEQVRPDEYVAPRTDLERALVELWTDLLGGSGRPIGILHDFFKLGGDSIVAIQLLSRLRQRLGVHVPVNDLLIRPSVVRFGEYLAARLAERLDPAAEDVDVPTRDMPLLPIQDWFFRNDFPRPDYWNQAFLVATPPLDTDRLRRAVRALGERHGALRTRYQVAADGTVVQFVANDARPVDLVVADVRDHADPQQLLTTWQSDFDLRHGPVHQVGYLCGFPDGTARVFVACHHLVVDAVSWRVITEDLHALYHDEDLPPAGSTYGSWAATLRTRAAEHDAEHDHWTRTRAGYPSPGDRALRAMVACDDTGSGSGFTLDRDTTANLLRTAHRAYHTQINDVLLAAFAHALTDLTGEPVHHIVLEGHGREEVGPRLDVSRTVGWFTTMFPVRLGTGSNRLATLRDTKETLRAVPAKGIGYGVLYGYHDDKLPRINVNYLGRLDDGDEQDLERWRITGEPAGVAVHPANRDGNALTVNGWITDGRLTFTIVSWLHQDTGQRLARRFERALTDLVTELAAVPRAHLTPSDVDHVVPADHLAELQSDREVEGVYLANSLQQGFIYQAVAYGSTDDAYTVQMMWEYGTRIDADALHEAWTRAQRTFPSLRLRFSWSADLVQVIDARGVVDWRFIDLADEPIDRHGAAVERIRAADRAEAYDLATGPLFRVYLIQYGPARFTCLFSHHHSILDGWSNTVLLGHVHECYEAIVAGLPADTTPDRGYPAGQRYLQEHQREHLAFWRDHLDGHHDRMDLQGLLSPSARVAGVRVDEVRRVRNVRELAFTLSGDELAAVRALARDSGVTSNALLLSLWHHVLACYTGSARTTTGVVVSGRGIPVNDIDRAVGLFINTLPLFVRHDTGEQTVLDAVAAVQRQINDLNARANVNLAELHEGAGRLFDTLFIYENWPKASPDGYQSRLAMRMGAEHEKLDYPLSVIVSEVPESIRFRLVYAAELLDAHLMVGMLDMQQHLLDEVLTDGERPWRSVELLSEARRREIAAMLNPHAERLPPAQTLVEVFEERARRHPERDAVTFEGATLTYGALEEQANQLANVLVDIYGTRPEELVVLCLDKRPELVVSTLAVLKARAAYVLTDPASPDSRIAYILRDTATRLVISTGRYLDRLSALVDPDYDVALLALDAPEVRDALTTVGPTAPGPHAPVDALMYVLYTSGTTNAPKGVMIEHRAYGQTIAGVRARYFADRGAVNTCSFTNHVFDIFGLEYGLPLWTGGRVELAPGLPASLDCGGLDFLQMTPSVCGVVLDRLVNVPDGLLLLVGGESLPKELLERVLARSIDLVNVYGPTETTIWSTSRLYRHADGVDRLPVSIGAPFAGESVHVLDDAFRPLPVGVVGELCVGGGGLARGYLNRSDLTAEQFVSVPTGAAGDTRPTRLYRTGDLVRLLPSGTVEFIGRDDDQVKIDGHRIELGEVEGALASHPAVRQSAVLVAALGSPALVGYYVADREISEDELGTHLRRSLPRYMLPARCVRLESMPLTANGKVDRAALPRPSGSGARVHVPPRSRTEADLCALTGRLLGLDPVDIGIDDDFFQLGGSSLLSIKLVSAVERELGISTTVARLLEHRTIRAFSASIEESRFELVTIPSATFAEPADQRLSFAQERLWFIERFEGGTSAYNLPLVLEVADQVDTDTLLTAVRGVVARHDVLCTLLKETPDGTGYQEVLGTDAAVEIPVVRMPDQDAMHSEVRRDLRRIFDLADEPPVRVRLYEMPEVGRRLVFIIHHVAFDGWSTDVLLDELVTAHDLLARTPPGTDPLAKLPAPPLRYRDFAVWQRGYLAGERLERLRRFWKRELDDHQNLDLVPDWPRPERPDYRGADIRLAVGAEVSRQLRQLAQELRVSLFSLLLSAHILTLRCFSNQSDIVVGTPVANRDHPQLSGLVGCFVNTLPVRVRVDGQARIADHVRETARAVLDMLRHQELPLEQLLEVLDVERNTSRHPIFQVVFGVQSFGASPRRAEGSPTAPLRTSPETQELYTAARFDISTYIDDSLEPLVVNINYATSLFERATVDSFAQTHLTILRQFADLAGNEIRRERTAIPDLAYVDGARYLEMVEDWSAPRQRCDSEFLLHRSVEEHARRSPEHVALVRQERRFTYRELNGQANRLAHHLLRVGKVGPNSAVMLCLDRSEDIVISVLATLKAGGGYLPVDPTYPDDRIGFMLADAGVHMILTHRRHAGRFAEILSRATERDHRPDVGDVHVIAVDDPVVRDSLRAMPETDPVTEVAPSDLAYVLYTSGTTGRPKGVPQTHANVARLFTALEGIYHIRADDVWTLFHNYVFDFTVWETWGAFLYGGRLVVPTVEETRDPELYYELCRRERVTMLCQTPTAFYQFVNVALAKDERHRVDDLRYVFFGGEPLNVSLLAGWFERYQHDRPVLAMGYGTTETTVFTCYKIYDETDEGSTDIGTLIPDVAGYVLDAQQRPLPIGAVGELHIGGAGLAPGFLNLPDLTTRKFIANPFVADREVSGDVSDPGWNTRLYKSGDLMRWAPNRTLRFVGRNDFQVKIRGHRIELGEIETVLSGVPGVRQCAVVVRATGDGGGRSDLVGYYVAESGLDSEILLEHLRSTLPTYMIPSALVPVDRLPRKISGKLDVDALPLPRLSGARELVAPRDEREARARRVLADVLGADPEAIGVHDDFFRLGGNSILSIKVASRLSAELGAEVSVAAVFWHRSVASLVESLRTARTGPAAISRTAVTSDTDQVVSFAQERLWFLDRYERTDAYNVRLCYEVVPGVDVDVLERCFHAVSRRHEVLRTVIRQRPDGELYQSVLDPEEPQFEVRHVRVTGEDDLAARFGAEGTHEFDLAEEAPFRITFYHDASRARTFVGVLVHHIAFDGWSADLMLDELTRLHLALSRGDTAVPELPELSIQYRDYAAWERRTTNGVRLAELLGYWKGRLHGRRPLEMPADRVRPRTMDHTGDRVVFEVAQDTSAALRRLAGESGVGLFSVLLSAYFLMLQAYTGRDDLLVGVPVANRSHVQTHDLIGCFMNSLAIDFDIDGDDDVATLIKKVGARVAEAQEYQELPLERLVAELDLPADPSRHPLFQIWFDVNSFAETDADWADGHELAPAAPLRTHTPDGHAPDDVSAVKLDLGLVVNDGGESLVGTFSYATSIFDQCTVARFASTYRSILTQIARAT